MKKNSILFITLCAFTHFLNANICPMETEQEAAYEPLKAFTDNGITTVIVPKESSIHYLALKHIIDNSITLKNMEQDHPDFFTPGTKLTFPQLTTAQIDDLLKLVAGTEMALSDEAYLRQKIERKEFFDVLLTLQTAEYLDIPVLFKVAFDHIVNNLQDSSVLESLNNQPNYITELLSYLSPAMQKEIAKKIRSLQNYKPMYQFHEFKLLIYESPLALNNAGTRLAVTSYDGTIYDINPGKKVELYKFKTDGTQNILFNPANDNIICAGVKDGIAIINIETNKTNTIPSLRAYPLAFDATGKKLILASKMDDDTPAIKILDLETHYFSAQIPGFQKPAVLHPDNNIIALSSKDGITLWDINKNQSIKTISIPESPEALMFDRIGQKLAISMPTKLMIIDLATGKTFQQNETASVMRFSGDNQNLIFASKNNILNWDLSGNSISKIQELPKESIIYSASNDFSVIAFTDIQRDYKIQTSPSKHRNVSVVDDPEIFIWETKRFALNPLGLQELITLMIAKSVGLRRLNKQLINEYQKLPQEVKDL